MANADALALTSGFSTNALVASSSDLRLAAIMGAPALCLTESGQPLTSIEECGLELDSFLVKKIVVSLGLVSVAAGAELLKKSPGAGIVAGVVGGALIGMQAQTMAAVAYARFVDPILTAFTNTSWLFGSENNLVAAFPPSNLRSSATTDDNVFVAGEARSATVMAVYRSVINADAAGGPGSTIAGRFTTLFNTLRAIATILGVDVVVPGLPSSPAASLSAIVLPRYLSLGHLDPQGLTGSLSSNGDMVTLAFDLPGIGTDHTISYEVRYTPLLGQPIVVTRSATLQPQRYAVAEVLIGGTGSGTLDEGATLQLAAVVRDSMGRRLEDRPVTWTSSNEAVATVSGDGLVSGVAGGSVTITATAEEVSGTATFKITNEPVATVIVMPNPASVAIGRTIALRAIPYDAAGSELLGRTVAWASSNTGVASVEPATGAIKGEAAGTSTITATVEGKSGSAQLTVSDKPVATLTIMPRAPVVAKGSLTGLTAIAKDDAGNVLVGRVIEWSSLSSSVAAVIGDGGVLGVEVGETIISASSEGVRDAVPLTVVDEAVASVRVTPDSATIEPGAAKQFSAVTLDADGLELTGRPVRWSSGNPGIARVDSLTGMATAVDTGSTSITALAEGKRGTAVLRVRRVPVASIAISPSAPVVRPGATIILAATVRDSAGNVLQGRTVRWRSSSSAIATVDSISGWVKGVAEGTTTITATSEGKQAQVTVTVIDDVVASVTLVGVPDSMLKRASTMISAIARNRSGAVIPGKKFNFTNTNEAAGRFLSPDGRSYRGSNVSDADSLLFESDTIAETVIFARVPGDSVFARDTVRVRAAAIPFKALADMEDQGGAGCALDALDEAYCWGTLSRSSTGLRFTSVVAGDYGACGLTADGKAWCWGTEIVLGRSTVNRPVHRPTPMMPGMTFTKLTIPERGVCGFRVGGGLFCAEYSVAAGGQVISQVGAGLPFTQWGNGCGVAGGDGYCQGRVGPVRIQAPSEGAVSFASLHLVTSTSAYGLATDGRLFMTYRYDDPDTWYTGHHTAPAAFVQIAALQGGVCGLTSAGAVHCYGSAPRGDGTITPRPSEWTVVEGHTFKQITAHYAAVCGLTNEAKVYCWGDNRFFQTGTYTAGNPVLRPTEIVR
jgi:uncharacterized protein YjdB